MKKLQTSLLLTLFIGLIGCGIEKRSVPAPVDVEELLARAWSSYDSLNFDTAISRFDSVLSIDATQSLAYFGKGMALGFKNKFTQAHNYLNLAIFSEGQSIVLFSPSDTFTYDNTQVDPSMGWYPITIPYEKQPVLYPDTVIYKIFHYFELQVHDTLEDSIYVTVDTGTTKGGTKIRYFTDSIVYVDSLILPEPEDVELDSTDTLISVFVDSLESSLFVSYYYLNSEVSYPTVIPILAYGANAAAYLAEEDYPSAIRSSRAALLYPDTTFANFVFDHYPYFNRTSIKLIEAYSAFRNGLPRVCVDKLVEIDSTWTPPPNPDNVASYPYILEELERLIRSVGIIF